jgi:hypothetical protein
MPLLGWSASLENRFAPTKPKPVMPIRIGFFVDVADVILQGSCVKAVCMLSVLSQELRNAQDRVERDNPSRSRYRGIPLLGRFGSEGAQRAAGDEMALQVEGVVDGGMGGEKALSGSWRLEALKLSFSPPDWQVRVLRPIILPQPLLMLRSGQDPETRMNMI